MSQVLNVLNLEIGGDPSGSGSSSSGSHASSAPTIVYVQDLVNEMTASLQAAGSSNVSGLVDDETNSSSSNSSSSPTKRPLEKESAKSSKRLKKSAGTSGSSFMTTVGTGSKLEQRLGGILCCAVCLDLPKSSVYQVCFILFYFYLFSLAICFKNLFASTSSTVNLT